MVTQSARRSGSIAVAHTSSGEAAMSMLVSTSLMCPRKLDDWFRGRRVSAVVRLWMPGGARRRGTVLVARAPSVGVVRRRRRAADGREGRGIDHLVHGRGVRSTRPQRLVGLPL